MATPTQNYTNSDDATLNQNGNVTDIEKATQHMSHEEKRTAAAAAKFGYGPLAHMRTSDIATLPAFGGEFQPGLYKSVEGRKFANPAPLGLSAFALTTFVLSLINVGTRGLTAPNIVVALAFGYGGLVQLLAGMWYVLTHIPFRLLHLTETLTSSREMAVGNTFGATALSSYGGFWISFAIILTPGGFEIVASIEKADKAVGINYSLGLYLMVRPHPSSLRDSSSTADSLRLGLVHFHLSPLDLHTEIDRRVLPALLHAGLGLLDAWHRSPPAC